jgi:hypothetical protein
MEGGLQEEQEILCVKGNVKSQNCREKESEFCEI